MHLRRFLCFLLGIWLVGGLMVAWIASESFSLADQLATQPNPIAAAQLRSIPAATVRMLLRYQSGEQNRYYFEAWEYAQIMLGFFLFCFVLFGTRENKIFLFLILGMLLIVFLQRFFLTPELKSLGRELDFAAPETMGSERARFWVLHGGYTMAELMKLGTGFFVTLHLLFGRWRGSLRDSRKELDMVNKADYRHINR